MYKFQQDGVQLELIVSPCGPHMNIIILAFSYVLFLVQINVLFLVQINVLFLVQINVLFVQFSTNRLPLWPMTYLTYKVSAIDGKSHSVQLYYDNTAEVNECVEGVWRWVVSL